MMMTPAPHGAQAWGPFLALLPILVFLVIAAICLLSFVFWIWELVDCLTNPELDDSGKITWVLVIVLTHFVGATIYYFVVRRRRSPAQARLDPGHIASRNLR